MRLRGLVFCSHETRRARIIESNGKTFYFGIPGERGVFVFFAILVVWSAVSLTFIADSHNGLGDKMKKKALLFWVSVLIALAVEGCATLRGMGEDLQSLGRALKRAVSG